MGIELGSVGSAIGRGISGLGRIGGEVPTASVGPISAPISLEGFVPMSKVNVPAVDLIGGIKEPGFNLGGHILFQAKPQVEMNEVSVLAGVEHILAQAKTPESKAVNPWLKIAGEVKAEAPVTEVESRRSGWEVVWPQAKPVVTPAEVPVAVPQIKPVEAPIPIPLEASAVKVEPKVQSVTEAKPQTSQTVLTATKPVEVQQEVEKVVEQREKEQPKEVLEEGEERERKVIIEDNGVTSQRKFDIKVAVRKAQEVAAELGWKKITGALVAKFMPEEYAGVRSQIIKERGPDGSFQETVEEVAASGEFTSEVKAEEYLHKVVDRKKPVKWGENGTPLSLEHVIRVFKYRIFKPVKAYTETVTRVVKKKLVIPQSEVPVSAPVVTEKVSEPTIKDFPQLEGVFPQAA